jgi:hypothetical protein
VGAGFQGGAAVASVDTYGDQVGVWPACSGLSYHRKTIQVRHLYIDDQDVRTKDGDQNQSLASTLGSAQYLNFGGCSQERAQRGAGARLIVRDDDSDGWHCDTSVHDARV